MPKRISIEISDQNYAELATLSKLFNSTVNQTATEALNLMSVQSHALERISKEFKVPITPRMIFSHTLDAASRSIEMFNEVLEKLDAKGHFMLDDFEFDLDELSFTFTYDRLEGINLNVDSFGITMKPGEKVLNAFSTIEVQKVGKKAIEELKNLVKDFTEYGEIMDLEKYDIAIEEDNEEFFQLVFICEEETIEDFLSIKKLSQAIGKLYKKSGILTWH